MNSMCFRRVLKTVPFLHANFVNSATAAKYLCPSSRVFPINVHYSTVNNERDAKNEVESNMDQVSSEALKHLKEENADLLQKVKQLDDNYKRALADGENTRTRMRKQIEETKIYAVQNFCKDLLDIADTLEIAVKSVPKERLKENEHLNTLHEGVESMKQQLQSIFRRHGLTVINPVGCKFDPNEHHAMFQVEVKEKEPGTISEVLKIGYRLHERTIRPAHVAVVKSSN